MSSFGVYNTLRLKRAVKRRVPFFPETGSVDFAAPSERKKALLPFLRSFSSQKDRAHGRAPSVKLGRNTTLLDSLGKTDEQQSEPQAPQYPFFGARPPGDAIECLLVIIEISDYGERVPVHAADGDPAPPS